MGQLNVIFSAFLSICSSVQSNYVEILYWNILMIYKNLELIDYIVNWIFRLRYGICARKLWHEYTFTILKILQLIYYFIHCIFPLKIWDLCMNILSALFLQFIRFWSYFTISLTSKSFRLRYGIQVFVVLSFGQLCKAILGTISN